MSLHEMMDFVTVEKGKIMAEYIDKEAAIQSAKHAWAKGLEPSQYIEIVPAADVEPVVRCRECKHHYWVQEPCHGKSVHYCKLPHMSGVEVFKEFFCYYGERKEGADND